MAEGANALNPPAADGPRINNAINIEMYGNPFNNNRNRNAQNNLVNMRDRLFHAIYFKVAYMYAQMVPKWMRRTLEYFILLKALLLFFILCYIHVTFIKNPATCLQDIDDWPRDGVLRVEVIPNLDNERNFIRRVRLLDQLMQGVQKHYYHGIGPQTQHSLRYFKDIERKLRFMGHTQLRQSFSSGNRTKFFFDTLGFDPVKTSKAEAETRSIEAKLFERTDDDEQYIVEYSLEYGHLRLSPETRKRLRIPVRVIQLDPMTHKCFGDEFSKYFLRTFLGYDDVLKASVRVIAEKEDNKGYLRNVITGEHYRFVTLWWAAWSSYPIAFFAMLLFTLSTSMLLRFSHHQIFVFIVDLLQMLEFNIAARFPFAPLLTVILALVGMEAIMSEFFNDTTTAFYIILIVWIADQYDAICCHTNITKRHWLRFFYLYHFAFYAYHYRFSGQNRSMALVCSWLFTQHSMFFFFHHYELPVIVQQAQILIITHNHNATPPPPTDGAHAPQQQQQQRQRQRQQLPTIVVNRIFGVNRPPPDQRLQQLPLVGGLVRPVLAQRGALVHSVRRALLAMGLLAPVRVRVQFGANLQRINLRSIHINPANVAAPAPAPAAAPAEGDAAPHAAARDAATDAATAATAGVAGGRPAPAAAATAAPTNEVDTNLANVRPNLTSATNSAAVATSAATTGATTTAAAAATTMTSQNSHAENESPAGQQQPQQQQQQQQQIIADTLKEAEEAFERNLAKQADEDEGNAIGVATAAAAAAKTTTAAATTMLSAAIKNDYLQTVEENSNLTQLESKLALHTKNRHSGMEESCVAPTGRGSEVASTTEPPPPPPPPPTAVKQLQQPQQQKQQQQQRHQQQLVEVAECKSQAKGNPTAGEISTKRDRQREEDATATPLTPSTSATAAAFVAVATDEDGIKPQKQQQQQQQQQKSFTLIDEDKLAVDFAKHKSTTASTTSTAAAAAAAAIEANSDLNTEETRCLYSNK